MNNHTCPMCGKFKETDFDLCRHCEIAQDHHPEEVVARNEEIEKKVRELANEFASEVLTDNVTYGHSGHPEGALRDLVDYVLGLLK